MSTTDLIEARVQELRNEGRLAASGGELKSRPGRLRASFLRLSRRHR